MAMFGYKRKLPQLDPGLAGMLSREQGVMPGDRPGFPQMPQLPGKSKPGLFGQGGVGRAIAGTIGDALLQQSGAQPIYAPAVEQRRLLEAQAQRDASQREASWQDWVKRETWKRDNPEPKEPSLQYFDDNAGNRYSYNPMTGEQKLIFTDPNDKMFVQDGQLITVPNVVRQPSQAGEDRRTVNGKSYVKRGNDWFEESGASNGVGSFPR